MKGVSTDAKWLTSLPKPSHPGSVSAALAGIPPSSTWSTGRATRCSHNNRIPFCKAGPTGPHVSLAAGSWCGNLEEEAGGKRRKDLRVCTSLVWEVRMESVSVHLWLADVWVKAAAPPQTNPWIKASQHQVCVTKQQTTEALGKCLS